MARLLGRIERRTAWGVGTLLVILIALRAAAPYLVKSYVNRVLDRNPDYDGHIDDVGLQLWRSAYTIKGVKLIKTSGESRVPLLDLTRADLSVDWKPLLHGRVVAKVRLEKPIVNFVAAPSEKNRQTGEGQNWVETIKALTPFDINRFAVVDGKVHYLDPHGNPPVDVEAQDIYIDARNLTNSAKLSGSLVAQISAQALIMRSGSVDLQVALDPFNKDPTFKLDGTLKNLELPTLNEFLRHYSGMDVKSGSFSVFTEVIASDGRFHGYAKPFVKDLKMLEAGREHKPLIKKVEEGLVDIIYNLFKNDRQQSLATRVEFSGTFENPHVPLWTAIRYVLHHAFIHALRPQLDRPRALRGAE